MITSKKWDQLLLEMQRLNIQEEDIEEKFILGSGNGGQKLQKTSSCVSLKHLPSGIQIKCQDSRYRDSNRYFARKRLCEKIAFLNHQEASETQQKIEKIKRQKKRRTRKAKQKILDDKLHQSHQKKLRQKPVE
jgi:protein subunit release factor B